jgi:hypothetical protein
MKSSVSSIPMSILASGQREPEMLVYARRRQSYGRGSGRPPPRHSLSPHVALQDTDA